MFGSTLMRWSVSGLGESPLARGSFPGSSAPERRGGSEALERRGGVGVPPRLLLQRPVAGI